MSHSASQPSNKLEELNLQGAWNQIYHGNLHQETHHHELHTKPTEWGPCWAHRTLPIPTKLCLELGGMLRPPWSLNRRCFWLVEMLRWTFRWAGDCTELLLRSLLGRDLWPKLLLDKESPTSNYKENRFSKHKWNSTLLLLLWHYKAKCSDQRHF